VSIGLGTGAGYSFSAKMMDEILALQAISIRLSHQRCRRCFPEKRFVFYCEPAELPDPVARGDLGYGRVAGSGRAQRLPHQMHPAQQQIPLGTNAQMLVAAGAQRPLRDTDLAAQFRKIERLIEM